MKNTFKKIVALLIALTPALCSQLSHAEVIYRNATGDLLTTLLPGTREVGDEIGLAGVNRNLTNFTFQYTANYTGTISGQLRFYRNDGPLGAPGTSFFTSVVFNLDSATFNGNHTLIFDNQPGGDFPVGGLFIPTNSFTWTIQFSNLGTQTTNIGPSFYSPVTVGNNHNTYWDNTNGTPSGWVLKFNGNGTNDFGAQLESIPEPSTFVLGLLGSLLGWGLLRRSRS